jgi:hypothetical protein
MLDVAQLTVEQNARIEARKQKLADAADKFLSLCNAQPEATKSTKQEALLALSRAANEYFSCVEGCINEGCVAGAFEHPSWLEDRSGTAEDVLRKVPRLYAHFREQRETLEMSASAFEPSANVFQNMQGILALCRSEKAQELKAIFSAANLPSSGFDKPLKPKPMKPEKNNPWNSGLFYLLAFIVLVGGLVLFFKYLPPLAAIPASILLVLLLAVVGALQLKNDQQLKDKSFVELMTLVFKGLPLLKSGDKKEKPSPKKPKK